MKTNWFCAVVLVFTSACSFHDDERCGEGYVYDGSACVVPVDTESSADTQGRTDTGSITDVEGYGKVCTSDKDCAGLEADYCAMMPGDSEGGCVVSNCSATPDDCPEPFVCCQFPESLGVPSLCLPQEQYDEYSAYCQGE